MKKNSQGEYHQDEQRSRLQMLSDISNGEGKYSNSTTEEVSNSEDDDNVECPVCHVHTWAVMSVDMLR